MYRINISFFSVFRVKFVTIP